MTNSNLNPPQNIGSGFVGSVLSGRESNVPNSQKACGGFDTGDKVRLFLISNYSNTTNKPQNSKPNNSKKASYSGVINHGGTNYCVNGSKKHGVFLKPLHKAIEQLEICLQKWGRVLVIRFDLHQSYYTKDSRHISRFRKNLNERLARKYGISEVGYFWVREQERAKHQHYHFVIMLDGNKVRHSSSVLKIVKATWCAKPDRHMPTIKNPYYFIDNDQTKADAIYRISYLAKSRGKGCRDMQAKDYSTSRLTAKTH
jgi:hypothetical protein